MNYEGPLDYHRDVVKIQASVPFEREKRHGVINIDERWLD